jgi:hypothetical protein
VAVILLEHSFEGPFSTGCYDVKLPNGMVKRISGGQASMLSMILAGYEFRGDFHVLEAFKQDALVHADAKVVNDNAGSEAAEGAGAA